MSGITDWVDGRIKVAVDEAADILDKKLDEKFANFEANVGAMFQTVSKDVENVSTAISGDIQAVSGAVEKSTVDTVTAIGQTIAGLPQQFLSMLPKFPFG
jgi:translation elongation factor EF-G